MKPLKWIFCLLPMVLFCQKNVALTTFTPDNENIVYTGRIRFDDPMKPRLCGAASNFMVKFTGPECHVRFELPPGNHHYMAVEVDGAYLGRIKITPSREDYVVASHLDAGDHVLRMVKATEALLGDVVFAGIQCEQLKSFDYPWKRHIEFIGNSITSGTGVDQSDLPCDADSAVWHDHHNAYLAYGPVVARMLDADWLLSSVSGAGVCRNWNSEGPTVPQVYPQTALDMDTTSLWDSGNYSPDLISVCLGTNDFSDGDGSYDREPLNMETFIKTYVEFLAMLRSRYPDAPICCLSSPVFSGEKKETLVGYLKFVVDIMQKEYDEKNIHLFVFSGTYTHGCTGHPNEQEQTQMAQELLPFFQGLMNW